MAKKSKSVKELIATADKIYAYRRDVIDPSDAAELKRLTDIIEDCADNSQTQTPRFSETAERLEKLMRKCGGTIYPLTTLADWTDMIIVAGIIALGIRSFFLQPFKIPTNSMYPSFYGMTSRVYTDAETSPDPLKRISNFALKGASHYNLTSPEGGDVYMEMNNPSLMRQRGGVFAFEAVSSREMLVIPSQARKYRFYKRTANGFEEIESVKLPFDFPIEGVVAKANGFGDDVRAFLDDASRKGGITEKGGSIFVKIASQIAPKSPFLRFDILTGDMLFVDRFTYNFRTPKRGESIVFRTKYCNGMTALNNGVPDDKYYIKRLAGLPQDELKIENGALIANGKPAEGSPAFGLNANKTGLYRGYAPEGLLSEGKTYKVGKDNYFALGDNSYNSLDSRFWGEVPDYAVVGKALVIFYPFTERWGAAE